MKTKNTTKITINGIDYPILGRGWCAAGAAEVRKFLSRNGATRFCDPMIVRNDYTGRNYRIDYRVGNDIHCVYVSDCDDDLSYVATAPCPITALEALDARAYQSLVAGDKDTVDNRPQPMPAGVWAAGHALADSPDRNTDDYDDTWDLDGFFTGPHVDPQIEVWEPASKTIMRMAKAVCEFADARNRQNGHNTYTYATDEAGFVPGTITILCRASEVDVADETLRYVAGVIAGGYRAYDMGSPVGYDDNLPQVFAHMVAPNTDAPIARRIDIRFV